jgi:hypothetical protein
MFFPSIREFKTFPDSVRYGIFFMLGGWAWFYIAMYTTLMKGSVSPRYLIGIAVCIVVLRINNIGRVLCILAQVMIMFQMIIPTLLYFQAGDAFHGAMTGLIVVLFGASSYFLVIKESSGFFKAYRKKEKDETGKGEKELEPEDLDPHTLLGVKPGASTKEIRAAYQRMERRYNPRKIGHKGAAYRELAEKRFKAIQNAYEALVPKKSKTKTKSQ